MTKTQYRNDLNAPKPLIWRARALKICLLSLSFLFLIFLLFSSSPFQFKTHLPTVTVLQPVAHPALDATRLGIYDALKHEGFVEGKTLTWVYENAQGNFPLMMQIAQRFVSIPADVIVTLGTAPTQGAYSVTEGKNIPIVFASVTDPITSKILNNLERPDGNVTGASNLTPIRPQFEVFKEIVPNLKRIGVIYNPVEANSVRLNELMIKEAKTMGLEIVLAPATKASEVYVAAAKLSSSVEALFVNNDNTALSAFESIVQIGLQQKIPVFVSDTDMLDRGALAALGPNQYDLGLQAGGQVVQLLKGAKVENLPVEFPQKIELHLNLDMAQQLQIELPTAIKKRANRVVKTQKRD